MPPPLLLFSFDLLQIAFLSQYDPNHHILLDQPAPATFKVLKNAERLRPFFSIIEELECVPICYSSKSSKVTEPVMSSINPKLKWIYFNVDNNKLAYVRPNHARLSALGETLAIQYGEGFSSCQGKQQLRVAICSAMKIGLEESRFKMIIFEANPQQISKLKEQGYSNIFSQIPTGQDLPKIRDEIFRISKESVPLQEQLNDFISNARKFDESTCIKFSSFHYFENRKNICPTVSLGTASNAPPIFRLPRSSSVCAIIFKYSGDKQLYIGKADLITKIGGSLEHESQQNKILFSCLHQTLSQIANDSNEDKVARFLCLPMFLSQFSMKHSLIKAYNKNKAHFVVKPYFKDILKFTQLLTPGKEKEQILGLMKLGLYKQKAISGVGNILALSILLNEDFQQKGFLQRISLLSLNKNESFQAYRTQFNSGKKQIRLKSIEEVEINLLSVPSIKIKLNQLYGEYLKEFEDTISLACSSLPILSSIFMSQVWSFQKKSQLNYFVDTVVHFAKEFKLLKVDDKKELNRMDVAKMNPKLMNYLVASAEDESFEFFTKETQESEIGHDYCFDRRNAYEQQFGGQNNFIIFGQCVPVLSLMKWIKSSNKYQQIIYLSLLLHPSEEYIKQIKMAKAAKKNCIFIIDHCEIDQMGEEVAEQKFLVNSNWGLRTIFIYRIKFGSSRNLAVVHDFLTAGSNRYSAVNSKLPVSHEEIFKTIFKYASPEENAFDLYKQAIWLYIKNKWTTYGLKAGIKDLSQPMNKLRLLVKAISLKNNRLVTILKSKEFNEEPSPAQDETMSSMNEIESGLNEERQNLGYLKNVSRAQIVLSCLPIFISNQRVWLIHDIHEFLSAYYLQNQIMENLWEGKLEGEQLQNFLKWFDVMKNKEQVKKNLVKMIQKFEQEKAKMLPQAQVMGANTGLHDCLQLLKRLGVEELFCKLDTIFYLDSPLVYMRETKGSQLVLVTEKCRIYQVKKEIEKEKEVWKQKLIYEPGQENQLTEDYTFIGLETEKQKVAISFAPWDEKSRTFNTNDGILAIKRIELKDSQITAQSLSLKITPQILIDRIVKITLIDQRYGLFFYQSGNILILRLNYREGFESSQIKVDQIFTMAGLKIKIGQKVIPDQENLKVQYQLLKSGAIRVIAAFKNSEPNEILMIQFKILQGSDKLSVELGQETRLSCRNGFKKFGISFRDDESCQILGFQQISDALILWLKSESNGDYQISRKLYRVENEPYGFYKYGDTLFVASKYSFVKRMIINSGKG